MDHNELIQSWKREEAEPFTGWDFSYLDGRMLEDQAPWSYSLRAAELMQESSSVLDMGTGGGERFLRLREYWPKKVVATEDYPPNFKLAVERLSPFGVKVVDVQLTDDGRMPFDDSEFDLVLNRHAAFSPNEVSRVLALDGTFLTQRIHGLWAYDLLAAFDSKPQWPDSTLEKHVPRLKSAGLAIINTQEWVGAVGFYRCWCHSVLPKSGSLVSTWFFRGVAFEIFAEASESIGSWGSINLCGQKILDRGAKSGALLKP